MKAIKNYTKGDFINFTIMTTDNNSEVFKVKEIEGEVIFESFDEDEKYYIDSLIEKESHYFSYPQQYLLVRGLDNEMYKVIHYYWDGTDFDDIDECEIQLCEPMEQNCCFLLTQTVLMTLCKECCQD